MPTVRQLSRGVVLAAVMVGLALLAPALLPAVSAASGVSGPVGAVTGSSVVARAVTRYSPPRRVLVGEGVAPLAAAGDGSVWGVARLGLLGQRRLVLLHRTPAGAWSSRTLPYADRPYWPLAVADDGRTTFFLLAAQHSCCNLYIGKVPHSGTASALRLLGRSGGGVDLIAQDGRWWATWLEPPAGYPAAPVQGPWRLRHARTLDPAFGPRTIVEAPDADALRHPRLAFRGAGAVLGVQRPDAVELSLADRAGVWRPSGVRLALPVPSGAFDLAVSGGRTFVALPRGGAGLFVAQDRGDLVFSSRKVPVRAGAGSDALLAASGGRVFVGVTGCSSGTTGRTTCRGYVADAALTGGFGVVDLTAPFAVGRPTLMASVAGLTAARGRATVALAQVLTPGARHSGVWVSSSRG